MRKTVYYTTVNAGDGSSYVRFFDDKECISLLEDHDPEGYGMGEGGSSFEIVQDGGDFNISEILPDLEISTVEEIKKEIEE